MSLGFGVWSLDRFGLWPRSMRGPYLGINLVGAVAVGFVLGRFSYLNECRKRLGLDGANQRYS